MENKNAEYIINFLTSKGIDSIYALSLIKNNPEILKIDIEVLKNQLFLILNHQILYAMLYVNQNNYAWSLFKNNEFGPFISNEEEKDLIVEMMISSIDKLINIEETNVNQSLELKMQEYRRIKKYNDGYHIE